MTALILPLLNWYSVHQAVIWAVASSSVVLLDWLMARLPDSKLPAWLKNSNGVLHFVEIQLRNLLGLPPLQQ